MKVDGVAGTTTDSVIFTVGTTAYRAGGGDNVVLLRQNWGSSEFNVFGDAGGSQGNFNKGTSIVVRLAQRDGTKIAPTCKSHSGTTAETTNLVLGACKTGVGSSPFISFIESN